MLCSLFRRNLAVAGRFSPRTVLLLFLAAFSLVGTAHAAPVVLRFANFPGASTFPCVSMERWAEQLRAKAGDAVVIETYPGGTLLEAKNMMRGVMRGQADIGCLSFAYYPGAFPLLSVFELPLGFTSAEAASRTMLSVLEQHAPAEISSVKVLAVFSSPPSQMLSTTPLAAPEDMEGLVVRAAGVVSDVAAALGASPVSMPQSDTPEALQKGVVRGVLTSFDVLKDYNYAESCRHGLRVDMPVYPMMFFMNKKKWDSLPPALRQAITELMPEHSVWTGRYVDAHAEAALKWAKETYDYRVTELTAAQKEELARRARSVIAAWLQRAQARGVDGERMLEIVTAAKEAAAKEMGRE